MTDIVKRLRERAGQNDECAWHGDIELEAANMIERLLILLAHAVKEAEDWHDDEHGTYLTGDELFNEARSILKSEKR